MFKFLAKYAVVAAIVIGGIYALGKFDLRAEIDKRLGQSGPPVTVNGETLLGEIQAQAKLVSVSQEAMTFVDYSRAFGLLNQVTFVQLHACIEVLAGVDLEKLSFTDVSVSGNSAVILLPEAEIISAQVADQTKEENSECYTEEGWEYNGLFLPIDVTVENVKQAREQAVKVVTEKMVEEGLLVQAQEEAKSILANILTQAHPGLEVRFDLERMK